MIVIVMSGINVIGITFFVLFEDFTLMIFGSLNPTLSKQKHVKLVILKVGEKICGQLEQQNIYTTINDAYEYINIYI